MLINITMLMGIIAMGIIVTRMGMGIIAMGIIIVLHQIWTLVGTIRLPRAQLPLPLEIIMEEWMATDTMEEWMDTMEEWMATMEEWMVTDIIEEWTRTITYIMADRTSMQNCLKMEAKSVKADRTWG